MMIETKLAIASPTGEIYGVADDEEPVTVAVRAQALELTNAAEQSMRRHVGRMCSRTTAKMQIPRSERKPPSADRSNGAFTHLC